MESVKETNIKKAEEQEKNRVSAKNYEYYKYVAVVDNNVRV